MTVYLVKIFCSKGFDETPALSSCILVRGGALNEGMTGEGCRLLYFWRRIKMAAVT